MAKHRSWIALEQWEGKKVEKASIGVVFGGLIEGFIVLDDAVAAQFCEVNGLLYFRVFLLQALRQDAGRPFPGEDIVGVAVDVLHDLIHRSLLIMKAINTVFIRHP